MKPQAGSTTHSSKPMSRSFCHIAWGGQDIVPPLPPNRKSWEVWSIVTVQSLTGTPLVSRAVTSRVPFLTASIEFRAALSSSRSRSTSASRSLSSTLDTAWTAAISEAMSSSVMCSS